MNMSKLISRNGLAATLAAVASAPAFAAQVSAPAEASDTQAQIARLQAQLQAIQQQLDAIRERQGGAAQAAPPPTSAASSGLGAAQSAGPATQPEARPRVFGPGIPTTGAVASIDAGHPLISTPDHRFTASLVGIMQFDVADYFQKSAGPLSTDLRRAGAAADTARARNLSNGSTFRRARIGIGGKAFGDFEYSILFDFGGSGVEDNGHIQELWLQYSGLRPAHIRVGAFAPFIGLEDAGSTNGMLFLERPASADVARSLAGGDFREGGQITLTTARWFASAAVTGRLVNASGSSAVQPYNSQLGFVGRAAILPVKNKDNIVLAGLHGSYVKHPANVAGPDAAAGLAVSPIQFRERPELRVDGTRLIDTGAIDAVHAYTEGVEAAFQHRNFLIQGEYERYGIGRRNSQLSNPSFKGFYIEGGWVISGERRRFNDGNFAFDAPVISKSLNPGKGEWGAWELALRYSDLDLNYHAGLRGSATPSDGVRGGEQKIVSAGVNWYLNSIARVMFDYQHVTIDRLSPNPNSYQTPVGAFIGQRYSTGSMRFQFAF